MLPPMADQDFADQINGAHARKYAWRLLTAEEALELAGATDPTRPAKSVASLLPTEPGAGSPAAGPARDGAAAGKRGSELPQSGGDDPSGSETAQAASEGEGSDEQDAASDGETPIVLGAEAHAVCSQLADAIDRTWELPIVSRLGKQRQLRETARLCEYASGLGLQLLVMQHYPLQGIRLARLAVRYFHALTIAAREAACACCLWLGFAHPQVGELLVEVSQAGLTRLSGALWMSIHRLELEHQLSEKSYTDLVTRLAKLVDDGPTWAVRVLALDWLELLPAPSVVPCLRRALRLPNLPVRWRALAILLSVPGLLTVEDVMFLLTDAMDHVPPEGRDDRAESAIDAYSDCLDQAISTLRPEGGASLLLRILQGQCARGREGRPGLNSPWALRVLAGAYPTHALSHVELWLGSSFARERGIAVEAAGRLPEASCQPLLLRGAADGSPLVRELARDLWLERFGSPCPDPPLHGVPLHLLTAPPSEALASRLLILRGQSLDARLAMVEVLFSEAPDREALALLTVALGDDRLLNDLGDGRKRRRLPPDRAGFLRRILRSFGDPGLTAICELVRRYPGRRFERYLDEVRALLQKGLIRKRCYPELRDLAGWLLTRGESSQTIAALEVLRIVGPPEELLPRLLELVLRDDDCWFAAKEVLVTQRGDSLDELLMPLVLAALGSADYVRCQRLCQLGWGRNRPEFVTLASEVLRTWNPQQPDSPQKPWLIDVAAERWVGECARQLAARGLLPPGWLEQALQQPESPFFWMATRITSPNDQAERVHALLKVALTSEARQGRSAVDAALALGKAGELSIADDELCDLLMRAPLTSRVRLLSQLLYFGRAADGLRGPLVQLFTSADPQEQQAVGRLVYLVKDAEGGEALLLEVLPSVHDPQTRRSCLLALGQHPDEAQYWKDDPPEQL